MSEIVKIIEKKYSSGIHEDYLEGLAIANSEINSIIELSLNLFENNSQDGFLIAEQVSKFFDGYLNRLTNCLESKNLNLKFWASCLLIHHRIDSFQANKNLLDAVRTDYGEMFYSATTILIRRKEKDLSYILNERLRLDKKLDQKQRIFIQEKIEVLERVG